MLKKMYTVVMPRGVYKRDPSKKYGMAANPNKDETIKKIVAKRRANNSYVYAKGSAHPLWKGGRSIEANGYIAIYAPEHQGKKIRKNYVYEHRFVMEKHLGRQLRGEDIHHIDGDRQNNSIDNLMLFPSRSEHLKYHWELQKKNGNNHGRWHRG